MLVGAINLCNSVRKTAIASESTPQVFLQFTGSNETIIWGFGLCFMVKVFTGKMHFTALHCTNHLTAACGRWAWERPCRQIHMEGHMFHTQVYKAFQAVLMLKNYFNYSYCTYLANVYCWRSCVGLRVLQQSFFSSGLIIHIWPQWSLRPVFVRPDSRADKWVRYVLTAGVSKMEPLAKRSDMI